MVRIRRPPEWGVEPVPESLRILRSRDLFVLWSSLGVGLLVLAAGGLLVTRFGLTFAEAALVSVAGSVVGSLLLAGAAHHGSRAGVPTMVSLRPVLGRVGSYAPTALNIFQLLGWTAFELLIMGQAAAVLTGNVFGSGTTALFIPLWGAICLVLALGGPLTVIRVWLERFAIWIVYGSTLAVAVAVLLRGLDPTFRPATGSGASPGSLLLALDLVVALPISWWPLVSDYNRFARDGRASFVGTSLGYAAANAAFYMLGAALVILGVTSFGMEPSDPYAFLATLGLLGLGAVPLIAILVDETDNAFADVYSVAVSVQNLRPRIRQAGTIVAATVLAVVVAWALNATGEGLGDSYETFLLLIGGLFVPLLGVVIADSFLVRRGAYPPADFGDTSIGLRRSAIASWIPAAALYFGIAVFQIPVGATLPSFATAVGLHMGLSYLERFRERGRSVPP